MNDIKVNDNKEKVIKTLGNPYSQKTYYSKTFLIYYVHDDLFSFFFNLNKFPFVGFYPFLRTGEEYWVVLENDKIVSFANAKNYRNNTPQALNDKNVILNTEEN